MSKIEEKNNKCKRCVRENTNSEIEKHQQVCPECEGEQFKVYAVVAHDIFPKIISKSIPDLIFTSYECTSCGWTSHNLTPDELRKQLVVALKVSSIPSFEIREKVLNDSGIKRFKLKKEEKNMSRIIDGQHKPVILDDNPLSIASYFEEYTCLLCKDIGQDNLGTMRTYLCPPNFAKTKIPLCDLHFNSCVIHGNKRLDELMEAKRSLKR